MRRRILLIQGHPDRGQPHFGHALADACADGAVRAGRVVVTMAMPALVYDGAGRSKRLGKLTALGRHAS